MLVCINCNATGLKGSDCSCGKEHVGCLMCARIFVCTMRTKVRQAEGEEREKGTRRRRQRRFLIQLQPEDEEGPWFSFNQKKMKKVPHPASQEKGPSVNLSLKQIPRHCIYSPVHQPTPGQCYANTCRFRYSMCWLRLLFPFNMLYVCTGVRIWSDKCWVHKQMEVIITGKRETWSLYFKYLSSRLRYCTRLTVKTSVICCMSSLNKVQTRQWYKHFL